MTGLVPDDVVEHALGGEQQAPVEAHRCAGRAAGPAGALGADRQRPVRPADRASGDVKPGRDLRPRGAAVPALHRRAVVAVRNEQLITGPVDARSSGLRTEAKRLIQVGDRGPAGLHGHLGALDLGHTPLDPGAELGDCGGGFAGARSAGQHDFHSAGGVDRHPHPAGAVRATDAVVEIHGADRVRSGADVVAFPDLEQPLRGERIALRYGAERDIPEILIAHQDDPHLHARFGEARPPSGAELGRESDHAAAQRAALQSAELTIVELGEDDCRGRITVRHIDPVAARAELRLWVAPQVRGRGYAREGLALAGRWLLGPCGFERIEVKTATDNEPMQHAATAAGFTREGILRGYWRGLRGRLDAVSFSLLPHDLDGRS
jgi:RimJ/RimL family protein N-acetyltransferase